MKNIFEMNMTGVRKDSDFVNAKLNAKSPIVEIFSAVASGQDVSRFGTKADTAMAHIKSLGEKASMGDSVAKAEINSIVRFALEPMLLKQIKLFDFMGTFKQIGYDEQPRVRTYKHESIRSQFQASQGDVPFATTNWMEYGIDTQTISSGYAVNYREIASGNLDKVQEGMSQVQVDMMNKVMYYVVLKMYNSIKAATGVKYFSEAAGLTKTAVDNILKKVRRFGTPALLGDYSMVSQLNGFQGFKVDAADAKATALSEAVMDEIRKTGLVNSYNGSHVVELPNAYNLTKLNASGDNFELYLPEGLMYAIPQKSGNMPSPLQVFQRGGITSASGFDVVTGYEMTRFDLEVGADVAKGREFEIGLISDTNFALPETNARMETSFEV